MTTQDSGWEPVTHTRGLETQRLAVPGGWLYFVDLQYHEPTMCFVPELPTPTVVNNYISGSAPQSVSLAASQAAQAFTAAQRGFAGR